MNTRGDSPRFPLVLEADELGERIAEPNLAIIALGQRRAWVQMHIPGAVFLEYEDLVHARPPVMGLLPDAAHLSEILGEHGITPDTHVIAYDDEVNGRAARLLWVLDTIGHHHWSLLNGGIRAWLSEDRPIESGVIERRAGDYPIQRSGMAVADRDWILARLDHPGIRLLDARSPAEYSGQVLRSARGGHIPGAVNFDWVTSMDAQRHYRLLPDETLRAALHAVGITDDREIVTYCQTAHRSSHTYVVLRHLGYPRVRGYPGSWSEWGNDAALPIV